MKIVDIVNEADQTTSMDYLGSLGKSSPHRGDPVMSPDLGGGQGPGGGSSPKVWRRGETPPAPMPKVWRRGETPPPSSSAQQQAQKFLQGQGFKEPTSQEKLSTAAQAQAKTTGEPVVTLKPGGLASRMLDKFFPEPKARIDPVLKEPTEPVMRAVEPKSAGQKGMEYWDKAMPVDTIGGKIVDKLMGRKVDEAKAAIDHDELLQDPNVQKMLNLIGKAEGAEYDTIVGGKKKITDFSAHPNIVGLRTAQGPSKAAGKYQITKSTYDQYAPKLGIRDFSPASQDKIALQILHDTGALKDVLKGKFNSAVEKAGSTWMSLPSSKIIQGRGPRSWDWVAKNLKDVGTTALATAVGASDARAGELPGITTQATIPTTLPKQIKQMTAPAGSEADLGADLSMLFGKAKKMPDGSWQTGLGTTLSPQKSADAERRYSSGEKNIPDKIKDKITDIIPDKIKRVTPPFLGGKGELPSKVFSPEPVKAPPTLAKKEPEPTNTDSAIASKSTVRQEFEREFAKQRASQGAGGEFDWTNPATGKTAKFTTDYAVEPKSKVAESINTELHEILRLAGRN